MYCLWAMFWKEFFSIPVPFEHQWLEREFILILSVDQMSHCPDLTSVLDLDVVSRLNLFWFDGPIDTEFVRGDSSCQSTWWKNHYRETPREIGYHCLGCHTAAQRTIGKWQPFNLLIFLEKIFSGILQWQTTKSRVDPVLHLWLRFSTPYPPPPKKRRWQIYHSFVHCFGWRIFDLDRWLSLVSFSRLLCSARIMLARFIWASSRDLLLLLDGPATSMLKLESCLQQNNATLFYVLHY